MGCGRIAERASTLVIPAVITSKLMKVQGIAHWDPVVTDQKAFNRKARTGCARIAKKTPQKKAHFPILKFEKWGLRAGSLTPDAGLLHLLHVFHVGRGLCHGMHRATANGDHGVSIRSVGPHKVRLRWVWIGCIGQPE